MGNATSIFNLMRNLGGSIGIAGATTYLARRQQVHINLLGANVDPYNPAASSMVEGLRGALMARGSDAAEALRQAYGAVYGLVVRQAAMLSFIDTFRIMGAIFLLAIPLLLLMKRPRHGAGAAPMH